MAGMPHETVRGPQCRLTCCRPALWELSLARHQGGPCLRANVAIC